MFVQFFGSYLLNRGLIKSDDLLSAIVYATTGSVKIGKLAVDSHFLTEEQAEEIQIRQASEDKRFLEIAVDGGYLTEDEVDYLLNTQVPHYKLFGNYLEEHSIMNKSEYQNQLNAYLALYNISSEVLDTDDSGFLINLTRSYLEKNGLTDKWQLAEYIQLLYKNFVRFIGSDFYTLPPQITTTSSTSCYANQDVCGDFNLGSTIDTTKDSAIKYASRYASMDFEEFDEYVQASLEDFLNLNNGLFCVGMSEQHSIELSLTPPTSGDGSTSNPEGIAYYYTVIYPFGEIRIILDIK